MKEKKKLLIFIFSLMGILGLFFLIIHHAEIKDIGGVIYMNDGDWVESCTALVEHHSGAWEIVTWTQKNDKEDIDSNRQLAGSD